MKNTSFESIEHFHAVGQGLFYSMKLSVPEAKKPFVMVFDCGSDSGEKYMESEIKNFRNEFDHVDLLVLSHLHRDHVNGLQQLLTGLRSIDTVVMPYLTKVERLLLLASQGSGTDNWVLEFMSDPIDWLNKSETSVREYRIVVPGKEMSTESPDSKVGITDDVGSKDASWDEGSETDIPDEYKGRGLTNLKAMKAGGRFKTKIWQFDFFAPIQSSKTISAFEEQINKHFKTVDSALAALRHCDDESTSIENEIDKLTKCYKAALPGKKPDFNVSSLVCLHGPTVRPKSCEVPFNRTSVCVVVEDELRIEKSSVLDSWRFEYRNPDFTLLSGDCPLANELNAVKEAFGDSLQKTYLFQIPHHGSKEPKYWKKNLRELPAKKWIVCFGWGNQPKHPGENVVTDIARWTDNNQPIFVTQVYGWICEREYRDGVLHRRERAEKNSELS